MVNKPNRAEDEPSALKWMWRPEDIDHTVIQGKGLVNAKSLLDAKAFDDVSDHLWYMTR